MLRQFDLCCSGQINLYFIEDIEESVRKRSISKSFETKCFQNRESLIEFILRDNSVLRAISKSFFDQLKHLLIICLRFIIIGAAGIAALAGGGRSTIWVFVAKQLPMTWLYFPPISVQNLYKYYQLIIFYNFIRIYIQLQITENKTVLFINSALEVEFLQQSSIQLIFNIIIILILIQMMISKVITRGILSAAKFFLPATNIIPMPKYYFSKIEKISHFKKVIDDEIKQEETHRQNITQYENKFKTAGWNITKDNTLVELSKKIGDYQVRLLSNIRSPTNFEDEENENENQPKEEGEEDPNADMVQIGIYVTKNGRQRTMAVNTVVTSGFQITGINFAENYNQAKSGRFSLQNSNQYTGPDIETLPDTIFESIYGFLQQTLGIENEFLNEFADYCLDSEQQFYLNWLKDIRSII